MDWRSVKFDWNRARAFLVTAEEGSLSAAAKALRMSQPTLGRQVSALEDELGVVLFERIGRSLKLTPSGLELVDHVRAMGEAAMNVSLTASGQTQSIEGSICITASEAFSVHILPAIVAILREQQPGITIEILASNQLSDLRRREADIAIRHAPPTDLDLIAKKVGDQTAHLFASKDYLARIGPLDGPQDMARADFIGFDDNKAFLNGLNGKGGLHLTARNFPILSGSHIVHWEMVKAGLGIGVMATIIGDTEPRVCRVAPWFQTFEFPVWLVAHREVQTSRRVRLVYELLAREIAKL
ncbi:MAG: LysR family transcriptional regulator [Hyphomicrobiales bacterium]|nr:LysR family transcriptional regulator [Hyphomicrobiales bacterium]